MRTVTFKSVLHGVAILMGLEPSVNLLNNQAAAFTEYINEHVRRSWEKYNWPDFELIEQRAYKNAWDSATAYVVSNQIYNAADDKYYTCILNSTNNIPPNSTYWTELTSFDRYVPYEQTGKTKLGEVLGLSESNPRTVREPALTKPVLSANGVQVGFDAPNQIYVTFRKRPNQFTSTAYSAATAYSVDDLVYYPTTGECYINIVASTAVVPTDTTKWTKVDFPYVLSPYVKLAAYSDALAEDEQFDKAALKFSQAEDRLMDEYDKIIFQQQQHTGFSVRNS